MSIFHCRSAVTSIKGRRPNNQDAVLDVKLADGRHLVAVADGMGGHRSGEVASTMALEVLARELRSGASLRNAVTTANTEIFEEASRDAAHAGMGTTLVALLRTDAVYEIANIGDSRAYRVDRHGIHKVSTDHSFAAEAASKALMGPEEIARSPWRNALTRSLGTQESIDADLFGPFEIAGQPHTVMLCSDGLYRALTDDTAWHHLVSAPDPGTGAHMLVDLALRHGSDDNISVAVIQFEGAPSVARNGRGARAVAGAAPPNTNGRHAPAVPAETATARIINSQRVPRSGKHSWLRRSIDVMLSDTALFGLCTGILMMWLALRLMGG